jgi:hypothetical protein
MLQTGVNQLSHIGGQPKSIQKEPSQSSLILTPRRKAVQMALKYRSKAWAIKRIETRRYTAELMDIENRDLLMKRKQNHSDAKSMDTMSRFKFVANPNDLNNSLNLV